VRFCINLAPAAWDDFTSAARLADERGFSWIGVVDSPGLFYEACVATAVLATCTSRARIGPAVLNPLTRHPTVTASALVSLSELSGGRAVAAFGSGDTSAVNAGLRRARVEELAAHVGAVRALCREGRAEAGGAPMLLGLRGPRVPVLMAAGGPLTARAAARVADGAILSCGVQAGPLRAMLAELEAGHAGDDFEVWAVAVTASTADRAGAVAQTRSLLAAFANNSLRGDPRRHGVPAGCRAPLARLQERYAHSQHIGRGGNWNEELVGSGDLARFLADRFLLAGDDAEIGEAVARLEGLGVTGLLLSAPLHDRRAVIERFAPFTGDGARRG
jgi:5,10-methylenetetrahydromethanopterin reductase